MDEQKVKDALSELENLECLSMHSYTRNARDLLKQALTPKERFYIGQQVIFSGAGNESKGFLKGIDEQNCFLDEDGSWYNCKPDFDAVSRPNWIEHDGSDKKIKSEGSLINIVYKNNTFSQYHNVCQIGAQVSRYCIIPLPEFLNDEN